MDKLFEVLVGKGSQKPKIITIVAENFSLLEDQARFLKATLAIPEVKNLSLKGNHASLIQFGPLPLDIEEQVLKARWNIHRFNDIGGDICDQIEGTRQTHLKSESIVFINDASRFELLSSDPSETKELLALIDKFKREFGHTMVILYQNSIPQSQSKFLRNLIHISDGVSRVQSCKAGYFTSIWYQKDGPYGLSVLLPMRVETYYHTCKIGKFYWSKELLCFYESKMVPKNYDLENDTYLNHPEESVNDDHEDKIDKLDDSLRRSRLDEFEDDALDNEKDLTLPHTAAQDPQKSRIFYYPDKEDDIDEDDPDNDLMI